VACHYAEEIASGVRLTIRERQLEQSSPRVEVAKTTG